MKALPLLHTRLAALAVALVCILCASCGDSNPVNPDTRVPFVDWIVPDVAGAGDTVFIFNEDTTTVRVNAGDDGGVISAVRIYLDGTPVATLTTSPYTTLLSLSGIRRNRSARVWATASDPTGKVGSTADTLRFVRNAPPDTATWTPLAPSRSPLARDGYTWELDEPNGRALLFGGYAPATFSSMRDLWSYSLSSDQWDSLVTSGDTVLSRTQHGAGLAGSAMMVFGGEHIEGATDSVLEQYGVLDLGTLTWTALFDVMARPTMAMSSATLGGSVYLYGGVSTPADSAHDSLVRYSFLGDTWQAVHPSNSLPGDRTLALLVANYDDNELFLYGGSAGRTSDAPAGTSNFRLPLGGLTWISTAAPGPPGLVGGAAVYDSANHRIVMWGGRSGAGAHPVEVWEFALGAYSWRTMPTQGAPPPGRAGHRLIYDASRNRLVMFGGQASGSWYGDTWQLAW